MLVGGRGFLVVVVDHCSPFFSIYLTVAARCCFAVVDLKDFGLGENNRALILHRELIYNGYWVRLGFALADGFKIRTQKLKALKRALRASPGCASECL